MASENVVELTDSNFEEQVLKSQTPVLVDFWAEWCGPCRRVAPEVEAVAEQMGERARVVKVDIESDPELASKYGIQSIPALFIFKGGRVVEQLVGLQPRTVIAEKLSAHV